MNYGVWWWLWVALLVASEVVVCSKAIEHLAWVGEVGLECKDAEGWVGEVDEVEVEDLGWILARSHAIVLRRCCMNYLASFLHQVRNDMSSSLPTASRKHDPFASRCHCECSSSKDEDCLRQGGFPKSRKSFEHNLQEHFSADPLSSHPQFTDNFGDLPIRAIEKQSPMSSSPVFLMQSVRKLHLLHESRFKGGTFLVIGTPHERANGHLELRHQMTPTRLMRTLLPSRLLPKPSNALNITAASPTTTLQTSRCDPRACLRNCRCFAQVNDIDKLNRDLWFTSTVPRCSPPSSDYKPPDERTLQLGKTVRTLHERLPTLLQSPLPGEILSPQICLHLFPSTHPHLPKVSGRIAYVAALWTAPVAWGRVPLVGNVKLTILSERMVRNGGGVGPLASGNGGDEKLIVKWKTCGKTKHRDGTGGMYRGMGVGARDPVDKIREFIAGTSKDEHTSSEKSSDGESEEFCGIFVFEFDEQGRIVKHVIEHTEEGGHWDRTARVVSVTDWLIGRFNGKGREHQQIPELAWCEERPSGRAIQIVDRRRRFR